MHVNVEQRQEHVDDGHVSTGQVRRASWRTCVVLLCACWAAPFLVHGQSDTPGTLFDTFNYPTTDAVFEEQLWVRPDGSPALNTVAWYRWSWCQSLPTCTFAADAIVDLRREDNRSYLHLGGAQGHATQFRVDRTPPAIASGFMASSGTWAVRVRLGDIEQARALMQSFWLMSPHRATDTSGKRYWSEFNHEWNNWFCSHAFGDPRAYPQTFCGDAQDTTIAYIANGIQRDGDGAEDITKGGFPMHAPAVPDAPPFSCLIQPPNSSPRVETDADACMLAMIRSAGGVRVWVDWLIRIADDATTTFAARALHPDGTTFTMRSRLDLTMLQGYVWEPQPLVTFIGQLVRWNPATTLAAPQGIDLDWFFYDQSTTLTLEAIGLQVAAMEPLGRVVGFSGAPPRLMRPSREPLQATLRPPRQPSEPYAFSLRPTPRETNQLRIAWRYRTGSFLGASSWTEPALGGFTLLIDPFLPPGYIDLAVTLADLEAPDEPAISVCQRYRVKAQTLTPIDCPPETSVGPAATTDQ